MVDHYPNRDGLDSRSVNLRDGSEGVNGKNKSKRSDNTTEVTGVCYAIRDKCWVATIGRKGSKHGFGRETHLGPTTRTTSLSTPRWRRGRPGKKRVQQRLVSEEAEPDQAESVEPAGGEEAHRAGRSATRETIQDAARQECPEQHEAAQEIRSQERVGRV